MRIKKNSVTVLIKHIKYAMDAIIIASKNSNLKGDLRIYPTACDSILKIQKKV